ncbi:MAG: Smr/MutS family protein [Ruminococcus sp.]|nr:MAG: Smr/MutS family protein [Ruminococcus sp.]
MERRSSLELDIRGCAVDEGIHEVDAFIDNAVMVNAGIITIIHGKGTGLLRQGIQRHLKHHPSVKKASETDFSARARTALPLLS